MGGSSFSSDQRTSQRASTGNLVEGPCRITSIQAEGIANAVIVLYDNATAAAGTAHKFEFGTEGLSVYVPGSGIRFKNGVWAVITNAPSVTITFN